MYPCPTLDTGVQRWATLSFSDPLIRTCPPPHPRNPDPQPSLTVSSVGDHCRSSTERVWPTNGRWSTCQEPPSVGVQRWMFF